MIKSLARSVISRRYCEGFAPCEYRAMAMDRPKLTMTFTIPMPTIPTITPTSRFAGIDEGYSAMAIPKFAAENVTCLISTAMPIKWPIVAVAPRKIPRNTFPAIFPRLLER